MGDYLKVGDAAKLMGVSERTFRRYHALGYTPMPIIRRNEKGYLWKRSDLERCKEKLKGGESDG